MANVLLSLIRLVETCRSNLFRRLAVRATGVALACAAPLQAIAGPPFSTDSPAIIGYGETEIDAYIETSRAQGYKSATLPGVQIDHGILPNIQLRLTLPLAFASPADQSSHYGMGDAQAGVKYRVLQEGSWWPQVSVFPLILLPSGSTARGLGQGRPSVALPIWLQKNFGPWKVYGGVGYTLEGGTRSRNSLFGGLATVRPVTARLSLGGEVFHKEPSRIGAPASTNVSVGGSYDFNETYHLYFSVGRGVQNARSSNLGSFYAAIAVTW